MQKMTTNLTNGTIWKSVIFVINDFQEQNLTCYRHRDGTCNGKLNESNMTCYKCGRSLRASSSTTSRS